jgi:hypothetical protein
MLDDLYQFCFQKMHALCTLGCVVFNTTAFSHIILQRLLQNHMHGLAIRYHLLLRVVPRAASYSYQMSSYG